MIFKEELFVSAQHLIGKTQKSLKKILIKKESGKVQKKSIKNVKYLKTIVLLLPSLQENKLRVCVF